MEQQQEVCVVDIISNNANGEGSISLSLLDHAVDSTKSLTIISVDDPSEDKPKKVLSAKKPPRPPQRAFSLDAADQKLIKELSMIKRARIERMKALMHQKKQQPLNPKTNYSSLFAMIFTILVFVVILFQGMSCQISCGTTEGGEISAEDGLLFIHEGLNPSAHDSV